MSRTLETVAGGLRFQWAGGSFITVRPVEASVRSAPTDMYELPAWVNVSRVDLEAFQAICSLYVRPA